MTTRREFLKLLALAPVMAIASQIPPPKPEPKYLPLREVYELPNASLDEVRAFADELRNFAPKGTIITNKPIKYYGLSLEGVIEESHVENSVTVANPKYVKWFDTDANEMEFDSGKNTVIAYRTFSEKPPDNFGVQIYISPEPENRPRYVEVVLEGLLKDFPKANKIGFTLP